ncbi:hypothetical protein [Sphingomonas sp. KR3-1]|uniref:hypothetical protein n=1 Tax=Sphingomonas sp. KR3-1 TaxID=3156611 RepID=UPI0032B5E269
MPDTIELKVKVSDKDRIKAYSFAYDADRVSSENPVLPIIMNNGSGAFQVRPGEPGRLIWGMRGDEGGSMKVELLRDGTVIQSREKSTIPPGETRAIDFFDITL